MDHTVLNSIAEAETKADLEKFLEKHLECWLGTRYRGEERSELIEDIVRDGPRALILQVGRECAAAMTARIEAARGETLIATYWQRNDGGGIDLGHLGTDLHGAIDAIGRDLEAFFEDSVNDEECSITVGKRFMTQAQIDAIPEV